MLNWRGPWAVQQIYKKDESVVSHGGSSFIAKIDNKANSSNSPPDAATWGVFAEKGPQGPGVLNWKGVWVPTAPYAKDDGVYHVGNSYAAKINVAAGDNPEHSQNWQLLARAGRSVTWRGEWNATHQFVVGDIVLLKEEGSTYYAKELPPVGNKPTDEKYWSLVSEGLPDGNWAADPLTKLAVGVAGVMVGGAGVYIAARKKMAETPEIQEAAQDVAMREISAQTDGAGIQAAARTIARSESSTSLFTSVEGAFMDNDGETSDAQDTAGDPPSIVGIVTRAIHSVIDHGLIPGGKIHGTIDARIRADLEPSGSISKYAKSVGNAVYDAQNKEIQSLRKDVADLRSVVAALKRQIETSVSERDGK